MPNSYINLDLDVMCSMKLAKFEEKKFCLSQKSKSTKASEAVTAIASVGSAFTSPVHNLRKNKATKQKSKFINGDNSWEKELPNKV